jgi:hypothetical protein
MIRPLNLIGGLTCLATAALVVMVSTANPSRPGLASFPAEPAAALTGSVSGAFALGDLDALPVPNGP